MKIFALFSFGSTLLLLISSFFGTCNLLSFYAQEQEPSLIAQLFSPETSKDHQLARQKWPYLPQEEKIVHLPVLLEALKNPNVYTRKTAIWALGFLGSEAKPALSLLLPLLQEKTLSLRQETLQTLGKIISRESLSVIIPFLADKDILSQKYAMTALYQIALQDEKAQDDLLLQLHSEHPWKIKNALGQIFVELGKIDPQFLPKLFPLQQHPNAEIRLMLLRILGLLGLKEKDSVQVVIHSLYDVAPEVAHEARMALRLISPENAEALPLLLPLLESEQKEIQYLVACLFCPKKNYFEQVFPLLKNSLQEKDEKIRANTIFSLGQIMSYSPEILPMLLHAIQEDPSRFVRQKGVLALLNLESISTETLHILDLTVKDSDPLVRLYSQQVLQKFRPTPTVKENTEENHSEVPKNESSPKKD